MAGLFVTAAGAKESEWMPLFDGKSLKGWTSTNGGSVGDGWEVENGEIHRKGKGGDMLSEGTYTDFELEFEWKVSSKANSGVKYRVVKTAGGWLGPEYQVLDDIGHSNGKVPDTSAASMYEIAPASSEKVLKPVGEWNRSKIVANGNTLEHWLNGKRVVKVDIKSSQYQAMKKDSKFAKVKDFGAPTAGHILLQDHGDEVWFRSIRIKGH